MLAWAMRIVIAPNQESFARQAAGMICGVARADPSARIGLPTGATPIPVYAEIERGTHGGGADFSHTVIYAVDEFVGVPPATPGANSEFFRRRFRVNVAAIHVPDSAAADPDAHILKYAEAIRRAGGLGLCVLGVGTNGHVAFNEPGSSKDSRARTVALDPSSRRAYASDFGSLDAVPARGMTLGVADLLEARALLVLAAGDHKAVIVRRALEEEMTAEVPASWLQDHPDATWLLDQAAASALRR